ncbi:MAG: FMN-binding glutamate synthase family protein [Alicyclobacillaceae bacterium]|nr:FMN-binding glutamate synthase family protein [Alicyclobacillaceae bacterium]
MWRIIRKMVRAAVDEAVDAAVRRLVRDQYVENLFEMVPVTQKVGAVPLMENAMRAVRGVPPSRPLGSPLPFSPWEQLLFNPVHLVRFPTPEDVRIDTAVTLGPRARKPLTLAMPVLIAGMSFGSALSKRAKIALAKAATAAGTATNTGEAGLLEEEREAAALLIGQYNRGGWLHDPARYRRLDAIEIQLGQGAQGSSPQRTSAKNIGADFREVFGLRKGEDAVIRSRLPGIDTAEEFRTLVRRLRDETGVPVGLKLAATHHLERELEIALAAGVDFVTVDGAEGGTHGGAPSLQDDMGLPTLFAVSRAADFLARKGVKGEVSLIAAGGLVTPGRMLKAMALGADAVYIGTAALLALVSDQMTEAVPWEPPTSLVVYTGKRTEQLDVERGARNVVAFLQACLAEMELVAASLGRTALADIDKSDLCALDPFLARALGVAWGWVSPGDRREEERFSEESCVRPGGPLQWEEAGPGPVVRDVH